MRYSKYVERCFFRQHARKFFSLFAKYKITMYLVNYPSVSIHSNSKVCIIQNFQECQEALLNAEKGLRITCVGAVWQSWALLRDGKVE